MFITTAADCVTVLSAPSWASLVAEAAVASAPTWLPLTVRLLPDRLVEPAADARSASTGRNGTARIHLGIGRGGQAASNVAGACTGLVAGAGALGLGLYQVAADAHGVIAAVQGLHAQR